MAAKFQIGVIGFGIGKMHSWAFSNIPHYYPEYSASDIELVGVCTSHHDTAEAAAEQFGFPFFTTDYRELCEHPDVNIVCVGVPDVLHEPAVMAAVEARKHVYCEKPLALDVAQAEAMIAAATSAGVVHQMAFQMRFGSAAQAARELIASGGLGELFSFRCTYQHSGYENRDRPISWRLDSDKCAGGALYDLGSHAVDTIRFLLGEYKSLVAKQETFVKERPISKGSEKRQKVEVDDLTILLVEMQSGVIGSIEATRLATGISQGPQITIHGSEGSLQFNAYTSPEILELCLKSPQKALSASGFEGLRLGPKNPIPLEVASQHAFLKNVERLKVAPPDFLDGLRVQEVLDASKESSQHRQWIDLNNVN